MSWWIDRLSQVEEKYEEVGRLLSDPEIIGKPEKLRHYSKEHSDLTPIVEAYRRYRGLTEELEGVNMMLREEKDTEMAGLIREEREKLLQGIESLEEDLKFLLLPVDPLDEKNTILEVRAGTGGGKRPCSRPTLCGCTPVTRSGKVGIGSSSIPAPPNSGGIARLFSLLRGTGFTAISSSREAFTGCRGSRRRSLRAAFTLLRSVL